MSKHCGGKEEGSQPYVYIPGYIHTEPHPDESCGDFFTLRLLTDRTGAYGNGKTHLLYAQYRELVTAANVRCHVRTTRELVEELRRAEFGEDFMSPVIVAASRPEPYYLFWDDIDKLKLTDFKTEVLFDLVDSL